MIPSLTLETGATTCANAAFIPDASRRSCGNASWTLLNATGQRHRLCVSCAARAAHKLGIRSVFNPDGVTNAT